MTQTAAHRQAGIAASNKPQPAKLLDRVRAAIRARHYGLRTEEALMSAGFAGSSCSTTSVTPQKWASQRSTSF